MNRTYHRGGARFVSDIAAHSRPLSRRARLRIWLSAQSLERRSRPKGAQGGLLGRPALEVLQALLFRFHRQCDGLTCPSYAKLGEETGRSVSTVARALKALERAGILRIVRRMVHRVVGGKVLAVQGSNLYSMSLPSAAAERLPLPVKPGRVASLLGRLLAGNRAKVRGVGLGGLFGGGGFDREMPQACHERSRSVAGFQACEVTS